jgi:putative tricarboxylic transport membrane protein
VFERALNVFWIVLGIAAAAHARSIGLVGPSGPESGLFPLIAGVLIAGSGLVLLLRSEHRAQTPAWATGAALGRVLGVCAGLAFMALGLDTLGFTLTSAITMIVLLRTVDRSNWLASIGIAISAVALVVWLFGHMLGMPLPRGPWGW